MPGRQTIPIPRLVRVSWAILFSILALDVTCVVAYEWHFDVVDSDGNVGSTSLALDRAGYPHIGYYGNSDLKCAYKNGPGWIIETVDSDGDVGSFASLALDETDFPHLSYCDDSNKDLKYAYKDELGWHIETVDSEGRVGLYTSLALDHTGFPHISYWDEGNVDLKYAYRDDSGWHHEPVDSVHHGGLYNSLVLDGAGRPHISYMAFINSTALKYAVREDSEWVIETVDDDWSSGHYTSLALDSLGFPHVSHYDPYTDRLKYATKDSSGWQSEIVTYASDCCDMCTSLALDGAGLPFISFYDWMQCTLKLAFKDSLGWHIEIVDTNGSGRHSSLVLADAGGPCISYSGGSVLKYAYAEGVGIPGDAPGAILPGTIRLLAVHPNPTTKGTMIQYSLGAGSGSADRRVSLRVYDCLGRHVAMLADRMISAGTYSIQWNADSLRGDRVPCGVYYLRIHADNPDAGDIKRLVVVK